MVVSGSRPREPLSFCRSRGGDAGLRRHRPEVISGENRLLLRLRVPSPPGSDENEVPPVPVRYKSGKKRCEGGNQSSLYFGAYRENTLRAPVPSCKHHKSTEGGQTSKRGKRKERSLLPCPLLSPPFVPYLLVLTEGGRERTSFRFSCVSPLPPPSMRSSYPLGKRGEVSLPLRLRRWGLPSSPHRRRLRPLFLFPLHFRDSFLAIFSFSTLSRPPRDRIHGVWRVRLSPQEGSKAPSFVAGRGTFMAAMCNTVRVYVYAVVRTKRTRGHGT